MKWIMLAGILLATKGNAQQMLIPAYFYPNSGSDLSYWDEMTTAAGQVSITAIMNPNNGPGTQKNRDYVSVVDKLRKAGGKVIGYVHTGFGARSQADVLDDVAKYHSFYNIDGIFVDEMSNHSDRLDYYQSLYNKIHQINASYRVFGNPGANTLEPYLDTADVLVTFEDSVGYADFLIDSWTTKYASGRFAHLLHGVADESEALSFVSLANDRNAGYIYITNDELPNPWDTLPAYFNAEVKAVAAVPAPGSAVALLTGMSLLGFCKCPVLKLRRIK